MVFILEGIFKGFVQWVYSLCLEMVQYIANSLLEVFQMDLSYFRQVAPVTDDILSIVIAVGWGQSGLSSDEEHGHRFGL